MSNIIFRSAKTYTVVGAGPKKVYPRVTFPRELAERIVGRKYIIELYVDGTIVLVPVRKK